MVSFVIYFHSTRVENLRQTLRFLFSRERFEKEVVLVCNDSCGERFVGCRVINLGLSDYQKPTMCNLGVREAKFDIVALLDSDRVLPDGYFAKNSRRLRRGEFMTCSRIVNLLDPRTDSQIFAEDYEFDEEFRSRTWELWRKNLFSGNTMFYKSDYLEAGGMDESFVGYGFADNDMTKNVLNRGFKGRWNDDTEVHLYHPKEAMESGRIVGVDRRRQITNQNMCKFLRKWRMKEYIRLCGCMI